MEIQAILLDLDGVLYIGNTPIPGAGDAYMRLKAMNIPIAGVTNTTTQSRAGIHRKLLAMGFAFPLDMLFTPASLAVRHMAGSRAALFIRNALREDFQNVQEDLHSPTFVVMGDVGGDGYEAKQLQTIFRMVMEGATILALHKNRFWMTEEGLKMDLGGFVAAVEYAANTQAVVLGKPSKTFFLSVCKALHANPQQTLMVGDDVESDIAGAQRVGMKTALVQTGKYREAYFKRSGIKPDLLIPSIADLPKAIARLP